MNIFIYLQRIPIHPSYTYLPFITLCVCVRVRVTNSGYFIYIYIYMDCYNFPSAVTGFFH